MSETANDMELVHLRFWLQDGFDEERIEISDGLVLRVFITDEGDGDMLHVVVQEDEAD